MFDVHCRKPSPTAKYQTVASHFIFVEMLNRGAEAFCYFIHFNACCSAGTANI